MRSHSERISLAAYPQNVDLKEEDTAQRCGTLVIKKKIYLHFQDIDSYILSKWFPGENLRTFPGRPEGFYYF